MKSIAHIISTIFQPLLMPTYGVLLIFVYTYFGAIYTHQFWQIIMPVILFSFIVPGILIVMLFRMGVVSVLSLKLRRERFYPYIITLLSYSAMIVFYYRMHIDRKSTRLNSSHVRISYAVCCLKKKKKKKN